jgi:glycosyltransferase involved in cell wall biosynthesis
MQKLPITAVILTKDEEVNLAQCLQSIAHWVSEIIVVDSHSTDGTAAIAAKFGATFVEHDFTTQAEQFNWALEHLPIAGEWVLRLDADEAMSEELWEEISNELPRTPSDVNGFYLRRRMYFLGRWIRHGAYYPILLLRLFRKGKARSEYRAMDEHVVLLEGESRAFKNDFKDDNKKELSWWVAKHNTYASREARAIVEGQNEASLTPRLFGSQSERKRWIKLHVYAKIPLFLRSALYFIYRYFFRLGFLDGKEGLAFHFLQGFWYRFLVDAKVYEMRKAGKRHEA